MFKGVVVTGNFAATHIDKDYNVSSNLLANNEDFIGSCA